MTSKIIPNQAKF